MSKKLRRIAITGAGGQIAYSLMFRLAAGELFGRDTPIALHLLEVPAVVESLKGVEMELYDCAFPLLHEVKVGSNVYEIFDKVDTVFLIGSKPRGPGMERKDLLSENGHIFIEQGQALGKVANPEVKVLVVGNPCNTNCLIAHSHAKRGMFFSMTRLDQNRATSMLAKKARVFVADVSCVTVWGNHSSTQVPDFFHAKIQDKPALEIIHDLSWLQNDFISLVQKRGAEVIAARGKSSAASAAQAALDGMKSLNYPTPKGNWFSMGMPSDHNPYGISPGLFFSFPCRCNSEGNVEIVKGLQIEAFLQDKLSITEKELLEERSVIEHLLG